MKRRCLLHRGVGVLLLACVASMPFLVRTARAQGVVATESPRLAPQSAFYVELMGSGVAYSLNYDFRAHRNLAVRAGFMAYGGSGGALVIIPVTASGLIGRNQHNFEIGGGPVFITGTGDIGDFTGSGTVLGSAFVAYRLQPPEGGFFFRAGIGPIFGKGGFLIWPLLSFGVAF